MTNNNSGSGNNPPPAGTIPPPPSAYRRKESHIKRETGFTKTGDSQKKISEVMWKKIGACTVFFIFKNILLFKYSRNNDTFYLFISIIIAITVTTHPITSNTGSASVKMKSKLSSSCFSFKLFMLDTSFPCISLIMNQIPLQCVTAKRILLILG